MKRSQFGEDEIFERILSELGHGSKVFCDIGARLLYSNAAYWIEDHGWTGVLVEQSKDRADELVKTFGDRAKVHNCHATIENVNALVPANTQALSIDIDSCDWWVWANLIIRPPLVCVETTPAKGFVVPAYPGEHKKHYGMSEEAAKWLGELKGYDYLGRNCVNAFFTLKGTCCFRLPPITTHSGVPTQVERNVF